VRIDDSDPLGHEVPVRPGTEIPGTTQSAGTRRREEKICAGCVP